MFASTSTDNVGKKINLGPLGLGDPDDKTINSAENDLLVTPIRRKIVRDEYCPKEIQEYYDCVEKAGLFLGPISCKNLKLALENCLEVWNDNEEVYKRAKDIYLADRASFRRTGLNKEQREELLKYLKEKESEQKEKIDS